jgi:hypothetical protein
MTIEYKITIILNRDNDEEDLDKFMEKIILEHFAEKKEINYISLYRTTKKYKVHYSNKKVAALEK